MNNLVHPALSLMR